MARAVGSTGRYGVRYGTKTKKMIALIESRKGENECPYCERKALKRLSTGVWFCKKCKAKFAGGAYFPKTK